MELETEQVENCGKIKTYNDVGIDSVRAYRRCCKRLDGMGIARWRS